MRTPGRCTNVEGCWLSASHRNVWLPLGEEFRCPNCGGKLSAPLLQTRSFRGVRRVAAMSAMASLGMTVVALSAVKLSTVSWPGQSVAATVASAPETLIRATFRGKPIKTDELASAKQDALPPLTAAGEQRSARDVAAAAPNSPLAMQLGSAPAANAASHPTMIYVARNERRASAGAASGQDGGPDAGEQAARAAAAEITGADVTVSQASLVPSRSPQRPLFMSITFGQPPGPETDAEPVILTWRHHRVVSTRPSGFLPAAQTEARPASADAIAQICRIPSLLH